MVNKGLAGCPCTNATGIFASLTDRHCQLPNSSSGENGIQLTLGGTCVPLSYGSSNCLQHDLAHDPSCDVNSKEGIIPNYCLRPWCYVDASICKRMSGERVHRSSYFAFDSGINVFYSYSTCNSTAEDWLDVEGDVVDDRRGALGGITIAAAIPAYQLPAMYKRDGDGEILSTIGSEYYDDGVPFEGIYPTFVRGIADISNGDIRNVTFTHRSRAASLLHPTSSYTAAVQDIQDGLVDCAVGPFWVTGQRLKMAAFTLPLVYDKTFLVILRPGTHDTLNDQIKKVLAPFENALWGLILVIIFVAALLSVWFSDRPKAAMRRRQDDRRIMGLQQSRPVRRQRRKSAYARLALDSFLQKGLFFCSAGVEQDEGGSLPNQLLMFGFGFFILIAVSAYVANLAAFLTLRTTGEVINTMEGAVAAGAAICAHPAIQAELEVAWPSAKFYFHEAGNEFRGLLDDYDAGKCRFLAIGWEDTGSDTDFLEMLCERNLVYTDSLIVEIPIAFPIRPEIAAGFSYWMYQGERYHGTTIETAKEEFSEEVSCNIKFSGVETEASDTDQITVKNMFFPLMFFVGCAFFGVVLQVIHQRNVKRGKQSLMGRKSTLTLVTDSDRPKGKSRLFGRASDDDERSSDYDGDEEEKDYGLRQEPISSGNLPEVSSFSENNVAKPRGPKVRFEGD